MSDPEEPMNAYKLVRGWNIWKRQQDNRDDWRRITSPLHGGGSGTTPAHGGWPYVGAVIGCLVGAIHAHNSDNSTASVATGMAVGAAGMAGVFAAGAYAMHFVGMGLSAAFGRFGAFLDTLNGFPRAAKRGAGYGVGLGMIGSFMGQHESMAIWGLSMATVGAVTGVAVRAVGVIRQRLRFRDDG